MNASKSFRLAAAVAVLGCLPALPFANAEETSPNTLTDKEKSEGWKLLFDGQTTAGWRSYQKKELNKGWKVADGALCRAEKGAGDIVTADEYDRFELSLEYKVSKAGNSGLMYHVAEDLPFPWMSGPEVQIQDNKDGHDPQKAGWVYQLYPAETDATKPAGEWNELRILITPEKCQTFMNGVKYSEYVKGSKDWDERVAKSKFGVMPNFGKPTKGFISLQDHGDPVCFRNIKIRQIAAGK